MLAQKYFAQILALKPDIERFISARRRRKRVRTSDAEDELQEALTEIMRSVPQYRAELGEFRPWAFGVALNVHRRFSRNRTRQAECFSDQPVNADEHEAHEPSPERCAQVQQARDHIENATRGMQPSQYVALYLFVVDDKSHDEIAEELGISKSASKQIVFRARAYLKQQGLDEQTFFSAPPVFVEFGASRENSPPFWRNHYDSVFRAGHLASLLAVMTLASPVKPVAFARAWLSGHLSNDIAAAAAPPPSIPDEPVQHRAEIPLMFVPAQTIPTRRADKPSSTKLNIPAGNVILLPRKTR